MIIEAVRAILRQDQHIKDIRVHAVAEREIDDAVFPAEWHRPAWRA